MKIVTRGLGGGQGSGLILMGMTFSEEVVRVIRGGRSALKDLYVNLIEEFTIAAKLLEVNGKELFSPIINRRKYVIDESKNITVFAKTKNINKKENISINVSAKITNIKRGSDGDY